MKDTNVLKRQLDQQIDLLQQDQLREVLDFVESLHRKQQRSSVSSIEEKIEALVDELPPEVWEQLPKDGAEEHDHYIYGIPKRNP